MLSRGHPELDALVGAAFIRLHPFSIENAANKGAWIAHIECLTPDGTWVRRDDIQTKLSDNTVTDVLIPGTRQRLVIECDRATRATDWHSKQD